jgi:ribosomal protein L15
MKPFFEGGQTSIVMRMPKHRGFKRYYKLVESIQTVNLAVLQNDSEINDIVTKEILLERGYICSLDFAVKILGN